MKAAAKPCTMKDLDTLITKRLKSSWGKPTGVLAPSKSSDCNLRTLLAQASPSWDDVTNRCRSHPMEVVELDSRSRTCLSTACTKNPPAMVVRVMVEACQFGVEANRDKTGLTALAIAIKNNAPLDVVKELSKSHRMIEATDHHANTALHLAFMNRYHSIVPFCELLLGACPSLAAITNYDGKTPLHIAVETKASASAIKTLLEASPESALVQTCGCTPLMAAIQFNANVEVYQLLVDACPESTKKGDGNGRMPLRCALEHRFNDAKTIGLLCSCKEAVLNPDNVGRNALHISLDRADVNPEVVELLLHQAPEACELEAKSGDRPIHVAYHRYGQSLRVLESRNSFSAKRDSNQWWQVVEMVLGKTAASTQHKSLLRAALATTAPIEVVSTILKRYPHLATTPGKDCCYPLMAAARMEPCSQKDAILNLLLDADATAAERVDTDGRSVLSWVSERQGVSTSTIFRLICSHPDAVRQIDPVRRLYPCLTAACQPQPLHELQQLGSVFELLLASPDLVDLSRNMNI